MKKSELLEMIGRTQDGNMKKGEGDHINGFVVDAINNAGDIDDAVSYLRYAQSELSKAQAYLEAFDQTAKLTD